MLVIVACVALLALGMAMVIRWGGESVAPAEGSWQRLYVRQLAIAMAAGLGAGVLVLGAGGRLVMRLLAYTSDASAQGRLTEANEVVGKITAGGTAGFVLSEALFIGSTIGLLYVLVQGALPRGRFAGLAFGGLLLVVGATRIEPLRSSNLDFRLVGPSWLAVTAFAALVVLHGMTVAAIAARYSRLTHPLTRDRATWRPYASLIVLAMPLNLALAVVGGVIGTSVSRTRRWLPERLIAPRSLQLTLRVALSVAAVASAPEFALDIRDIVTD